MRVLVPALLLVLGALAVTGRVGGPPPAQWATLVPRQEWEALPPRGDADRLDTPVEYIVIHDTQTAPCASRAECSAKVRAIQRYHMDVRNWTDVAYNFLAGGDGLAYEGRGWDAVGSHTLGWNAPSLGISYIGHFNDSLPPSEQNIAVLNLIAEGVSRGKVSPRYQLVPACQLRNFQSPGRRLAKFLTTWTNWSRTSVPGSTCAVQPLDDDTDTAASWDQQVEV